MHLIVAEDYDGMSRMAADCFCSMADSHQRRNAAVTAGSTPIGMYGYLVEYIRERDVLGYVHFYNFDEIPYRGEERDGITMESLKKYFYEPACIPEARIHTLTDKNYQTYDKLVASDGGLDVCVLGIGRDGHFCSNTPGKTKWGNQTVKLPVYPHDRERIARLMFGGNVGQVPDFLITMGPRSIMASRQLLLLASGKEKAEAVRALIATDIVDESIPSTILKLHPSLTVIADRDALSLIPAEFVEEMQWNGRG